MDSFGAVRAHWPHERADADLFELSEQQQGMAGANAAPKRSSFNTRLISRKCRHSLSLYELALRSTSRCACRARLEGSPDLALLRGRPHHRVIQFAEEGLGKLRHVAERLIHAQFVVAVHVRLREQADIFGALRALPNLRPA